MLPQIHRLRCGRMNSKPTNKGSTVTLARCACARTRRAASAAAARSCGVAGAAAASAAASPAWRPPRLSAAGRATASARTSAWAADHVRASQAMCRARLHELPAWALAIASTGSDWGVCATPHALPASRASALAAASAAPAAGSQAGLSEARSRV